PETIVASPYYVIEDEVGAERRLDPVRGRVREVIVRQHVAIGSPRTAVHRALTRPQEESIAAMRGRVEVHDVLGRLLEEEQVGRILAATIEAMAVAADIVVQSVALDVVARAPVEADAESRVEAEIVALDPKAVAARA